eukprot:CAMPEP_0195101728 /NCGR_PEP_ID=MMETSP0448-20130528/65287_1 /TAXON_ID=66468 /ORGANISM="Heterocapsa triquestra, Strain CCMP 448" /LENGTH=89 /DNA_ID=CAMNT_0040137087 /DNA_START=8 /DNA_END=274 /DNA_ORIENTATION=+
MWTPPKGEGAAAGGGQGDMKLNPVDTTFYMALPTALFLCPPTFLMEHPTEWPGSGNDKLTDWSILMKVMELSPHAINLVLLSGVFAAAY